MKIAELNLMQSIIKLERKELEFSRNKHVHKKKKIFEY